MKDPVEKFEQQQAILEGIFKNIIKKLTPTPGASTTHSIAGRNAKNAQTLRKNQISVENGNECKGIKAGKKPNELFWSKTGDRVGIFGKNRNVVDDLGDWEISKRELRCYDIVKDIYKIGWLFADDAKYHATKIWGKKNEVHFEGTWEGGVFKGYWHSPQENWKTDIANFKGYGIDTITNPHPSRAQVVVYTVMLSNGSRYLWDVNQIIEKLAKSEINLGTQVFRDGLNEKKQFIFLSQLPEYPQIKAAVDELKTTLHPSTTPGPQLKKYYLFINKKQIVKHIDELIEMYADGQINDNTYAYTDGLNPEKTFVFLSQLPDYSQIKTAALDLIAKRASASTAGGTV